MSSSAQSPFVTYEPTPSTNQSNQGDKETTRVSGYVKDLSGNVRKVSLQVSFRIDSNGKETVTILKLLEKQSSYFTSNGNNWKTVNARAYYCNDNCDFTFYTSYAGGYIYFDN